MANEPRPVQLDELISKYEGSNGYVLYGFIRNSQYLADVHNHNYSELSALIEEYENATKSVQKNTEFKSKDLSQQETREYFTRFTRLLHNYCASLYTLEQNYNEFFNDTRYGAGYDAEIGKLFKELLLNPRHLFFFAIRNCFTHYSIPALSVGVLSKRDDIESKVFNIETRGRLTICKSFFLSDFHKKKWQDESAYESRLLVKGEQLSVLYDYIQYGRFGLSIEVKDILIEYHKELTDHLDKINQILINKNNVEYAETRDLIDEIKIRQSKLWDKER